MTKRALRLHEKYTREQLVEMQKQLRNDSRYLRHDPDSIWLLNADGQRLHDDIGWAIYWKDAPQGNTHMQREPALRKYW